MPAEMKIQRPFHSALTAFQAAEGTRTTSAAQKDQSISDLQAPQGRLSKTRGIAWF